MKGPTRTCVWMLAALLMVGVATKVTAGDPMPDVADHAALAAMYSSDAKALREKVASHQLMLERYEKAGVSAKGMPFPKEALVQHCRKLVAAYEQGAADAEQMAKMEGELAKASPAKN